MILVLEKDDGSLFLFSSKEEAESHCETIDVENGEYEFYDDRGQRFVGEIIEPVGVFRAGSFRLKPDGLPNKAVAASLFSRTRSLERGCDNIKSLNDLGKLLKA